MPVHPNHTNINAEKALEDNNSIFYTYQRLIQLRKELAVIVEGKYEVVTTQNANVLAYLREFEEDCLLVVVNFSKDEQDYQLTFDASTKERLIHNYPEEQTTEGTLKAYEAFADKI